MRARPGAHSSEISRAPVWLIESIAPHQRISSSRTPARNPHCARLSATFKISVRVSHPCTVYQRLICALSERRAAAAHLA